MADLENETKVDNQVNFLSDHSSNIDLLDYGIYCDTFSTIIKDYSSDDSFAIGIYGSWGSGKSTLMKMIKKALEDLGYVTVWIDSWFLDKKEEEIWKLFLQSIFLYTKDKLTTWQKIKFFFQTFDDEKLKEKLPSNLLKIIVITPIIYFILSNFDWSVFSMEELTTVKVVDAIWRLLASVVGIIWGIQPFFSELKTRFSFDLQNLLLTAPLKKQVSVIDEFKHSLADVVSVLAGKDKRVVFFVDDLDRNYPEQIPQILDTLKRFLTIDKCVFVLGMDDCIIEKAISQKYKSIESVKGENDTEDMNGGMPEISSIDEARYYLEKIINIPFDLPQLTKEQIKGFVDGLNVKLPDEECKKVFINGQEANPRKVKRTINLFLILWTLVNHRKELIGKINPVRLAKLVVIQLCYRDLFLLIEKRPKFIGELECYFRCREKNIQYKPENPQTVDFLNPFMNNETLKGLFLIHDSFQIEYIFSTNANGEFKALEESVVEPYTKFTQTVAKPVKEFSPEYVETIIGKQDFQQDQFAKIKRRQQYDEIVQRVESMDVE